MGETLTGQSFQSFHFCHPVKTGVWAREVWIQVSYRFQSIISQTYTDNLAHANSRTHPRKSTYELSKFELDFENLANDVRGFDEGQLRKFCLQVFVAVGLDLALVRLLTDLVNAIDNVHAL